jgi:hypothetical protein
MKSIIFLCCSLFIFTANANEPADTCANLDINQQWRIALTKSPNDHLLLKLASLRSDLCEMIENNSIDVDTAWLMWEQALTTALLERTREDQARRGLLRVFGTF